MQNEKDMLQPPSNETLFRYLLVAKVLALKQQGAKNVSAINAIAQEAHKDPQGTLRTISSRTLRRWLNAYEARGFKGLLPKVQKRAVTSQVISPEVLAFCKQQKEKDPLASVPELIRRAKELDLIESIQAVDRTTLWRSLKRMGVNTRRSKLRSGFRDKRRFAYPHRMDMVLCDGKHFRAGPSRLRRVALFFLDDATRLGLSVVVGTSETSELFLRGLYDCFLRYGAGSALYVDNGSGFKAGDSITILNQLGTLFIHGEAGYPAGRGKIERFNQTALMRCLRHLDGNPEVNPDPSALELRLCHFLFQQYNHSPHESLEHQTPWQRFSSDQRPLRFRQSTQTLRRAFVIHHQRRVSGDNVVSFKGNHYEMPTGYEGRKVTLCYHVLDQSVSFMHKGKEILLYPPDVHANALDKRGKTKTGKANTPTAVLPNSSAQIAFNRDHRPIVDTTGGFQKPSQDILKSR